MTGTEYPWLLPSAMAGAGTPALPGDRGRARPRRTVRDWVVDTHVFLLAAGVGLLGVETSEQVGNIDLVVFTDLLSAAAACGALWLRRRWPVGLAVVLAVLSMVLPAASGAALLSLFGVAVHRPFRPVAVIGALFLLTGVVQSLLRPDPDTSWPGTAVFTVLVILSLIGWGMLVRARRQLVIALRERAQRAEAVADLRAHQAQRLAREAIAREMHDVLAHRLSLLSVHAGALEFRPDAPAPEVARAAGVIRDSAHEALQDLRTIIGVLRAPGDDGDRPQPTLVTLDALVAESRHAGMQVILESRVGDPSAVPAATGRTAYRIAQEGLTNARKHAPGTETTVVVGGEAGQGLTVEVRNSAPQGAIPVVPGSGQGLIGLTERAALAGGRFEHGTDPDGGFTVRAWLPWAL